MEFFLVTNMKFISMVGKLIFLFLKHVTNSSNTSSNSYCHKKDHNFNLKICIPAPTTTTKTWSNFLSVTMSWRSGTFEKDCQISSNTFFSPPTSLDEIFQSETRWSTEHVKMRSEKIKWTSLCNEQGISANRGR